jgi:hypothetical protein
MNLSNSTKAYDKDGNWTHNVIVLNPKYEIRLPKDDYLAVVVGALTDSPAASFTHPNMVAKIARVENFKHYHSKRGKFWTTKAGLDMVFVIPMNKIELVGDGMGYSYVPVSIGGQKTSLNVSGGTIDLFHFDEKISGWGDFVCQLCHTQCIRSKKFLKAIASASLSLDECKQLGISFDITSMDESETKEYMGLMAAAIVRPQIRPGWRIKLGNWYSWQGNTEFTISQVVRRHYRCDDGYSSVRVYPKHINWLETAALNHIAITLPETFNLLGACKQRGNVA